MKKVISVAVAMLMAFVFVGKASAVKPDPNLAGAGKVSWNLSGDVMPVPPHGAGDIVGSDTASKLIVNQPNGNTEVAITGAMNGLNPDTTYTVYLSDGYTPFTFEGWSIAGTWVIDVEYLGTDYPEDLVLTLTAGNYTGTLALVNPPGGSPFTITSGSVVGNSIELNASHDTSPLTVTLTGTIAPDGSMSGDWADNPPNTRIGTWASTSGVAIPIGTGDRGWPGFFTSTIPAFTFETDADGAGSWHVNLRDEDFIGGPGTYDLSVWLNGGGRTILISDPFEVVVD